MDPLIVVMGIFVLLALFMIVVMNARIKQLSDEIKSVKANVKFTNDELHQLSRDIEDFKTLIV